MYHLSIYFNNVMLQVAIKETENSLLISDISKMHLDIYSKRVKEHHADLCYCMGTTYLLPAAVEANKQVSNNISRYHVQCNIS